MVLHTMFVSLTKFLTRSGESDNCLSLTSSSVHQYSYQRCWYNTLGILSFAAKIVQVMLFVIFLSEPYRLTLLILKIDFLHHRNFNLTFLHKRNISSDFTLSFIKLLHIQHSTDHTIN